MIGERHRRRDVLRTGTLLVASAVGLSAGTGVVAASSEDAEIDIKPGSDPNSISRGSEGIISVGFEQAGNSNFQMQGDRVIIGKTTFEEDGITEPVEVPRFAPAEVFNTNSNGNPLTTKEVRSALRSDPPKGIPPVSHSVEDFNGDGDPDLVLRFDTQDFFDLVDDPSAVETGVLIGIMEWDGSTDKRLFDGSDSIQVVGGASRDRRII